MAAGTEIADRRAMTTPSGFALIFTGLLLVAVGLFVAGNLAVVALGVTALVVSGVAEAAPTRSR
jgi:hypothetical protein